MKSGSFKPMLTARYYAITDHLGSVTEVTDESGKTVWESEYLPFGSVAGAEGALEFGGMYTGKDIDAETGLTYHWNRWRSEDGSSFISEDPARDGMNWYGYCGGNPMNSLDPTGLWHYNGNELEEDDGDYRGDEGGYYHDGGGGVTVIGEKPQDTEKIVFPENGSNTSDENEARRQLFNDLRQGGIDALAESLNDYFINKKNYSVSHLQRSKDTATFARYSSDAIYYQILEFFWPDDIYEFHKAWMGAWLLGGLPWDDIAIASSQVASNVLQRFGNKIDEVSNITSRGVNPNILSGHGGYEGGVLTVPEGTSVTVWTEHGNSITDALGNAIETGSPITDDIFSEVVGARTYLSGSTMPNYTLYPPTGLNILGNPTTVSAPTALRDLLTSGMGNVNWAACLNLVK